ncbi:MAG: hypothetical protein GY926_12245 [bacterium]|nr:hypothetical protein [bacterium]
MRSNDRPNSPDELAELLTTADELVSYIGHHESRLVELKKGRSPAKTCTAVAAMANDEAGAVGLIALGVAEGAPPALEGLKVTDGVLKRVRREISDSVSPPPTIQIWTIGITDGTAVLCIGVQGDGVRVYEYRGQPYRRVGSENVKMSRNDAFERRVVYSGQESAWEGASSNEPASSLDPAYIQRFLRAARLNQGASGSDEEVLLNYGITTADGRTTNAGLALFGHKDRLGSVMPQCLFQAGRFESVRALRNPVDQVQGEMCILAQFDAGTSFVERHLSKSPRSLPDGTRVDLLEIPNESIREIFLNALVHRDYVAPNGRVALHVGNDEVRIISSGSMVPGIEYSFLAAKSGELGSKFRNPVMGRVLHAMGLVERWGGGIKTAVDATLAQFLPAPRFRLGDDQVSVALVRPDRLPDWVADVGLLIDDLLVWDCLAAEPLTTRDLRRLTQLTRQQTTESIQRLTEVGAVELPEGPSGVVRRRDWDGLDFR